MQLPIPDSAQLPLPDAITREAFPPPTGKGPPPKKKGKPPVEDEEAAPAKKRAGFPSKKATEPPIDYDEAPPEAEEDEEDVEYDEAPEGDPADAKLHADEEEAPPKKKGKGKGKKVVVTIATEAHGEIHSAKAHRCVDEVGAKGGVDEPWAVCTASIGKAGVYAKGHGGSASPKRKVRETDRAMDAYVEALVEAIRAR